MAPVKKKVSNVTPESTSGTIASENQTPKSLKPVGKIAKGTPNESIKDASKSPLVPAGESKKKKKRVLIKKKASTGNKKEATDLKESMEIKGTSIVNEENKEKGKEVIKIEEKDAADSGKKEKGKEAIRIDEKHAADSGKKEKGKEVIRTQGKLADSGKAQQNGKNKEKSVKLGNQSKEDRRELQRKQPTEKGRGKHNKSEKNGKSQMNRETFGQQDSQRDEKKKEKLGGLIFMCNAKTKPDCFRYHVMGLPMSKKDLVSGVKPGLKIFLYDFDLKLLYGIYKASTSGGMKLEPDAFNGAFPVQVRFDVHEDCYPLPESVFKRAIKENYNERNKFKTELSFQQVHKLLKLFRPAQVRSRTPPKIVVAHEREPHNESREAWENPVRESFVRDPSRSRVESKENERHLAYREVIDIPSTRREDISRDYYPSEKEYRTHGLARRERQNLSPIGHVAPPTLEPYSGAYVREREPILTETAPLYREIVHAAPGQVAASHDPHLVTEKQILPYTPVPRREQQTSTPFATTALTTTLETYPGDPYYTQSSSLAYWPSSRREEPSSLDKYGVPSRREETQLGSYSLGGRGELHASVADRLETRGYDLSQDRLGSYSLGGREVYPSASDQLGPREVYLTRGESYLSESSELGRTGRDYGRLVQGTHARVESSFAPVSSFAASDLSSREQVHSSYQDARAELSFAPVSSRYSFAGPPRR